jgi:hypothetical protein
MTTGSEPPRPAPARGQPIKLDMPVNLPAQYANFAMITFSLSEVFLDFAQLLPNTPQARIQTRIILTPTNAKLLYKALGESLAKYEESHGEIKVPPTLADQLFGGVRIAGAAQIGGETGESGPDHE